MKVTDLLLRFAIFYPVLIIVFGFIVKMLGFNSLSGVNIAIIVLILMLLVEEFVKQNKRYFNEDEFNNVFAGVVLINVFYQALFSYLAGINLSSSVYYFIFSLILIGVLHGIFIYVILKLMRRNLIKRKILIETDGVIEDQPMHEDKNKDS